MVRSTRAAPSDEADYCGDDESGPEGGDGDDPWQSLDTSEPEVAGSLFGERQKTSADELSMAACALYTMTLGSANTKPEVFRQAPVSVTEKQGPPEHQKTLLQTQEFSLLCRHAGKADEEELSSLINERVPLIGKARAWTSSALNKVKKRVGMTTIEGEKV